MNRRDAGLGNGSGFCEISSTAASAASHAQICPLVEGECYCIFYAI